MEEIEKMAEVRLGVLLWSQGTDWERFESAARRVDELGYDHLWTWDHLYAIFGDPYQPIYEGWTTLAAWSKVTRRARLGLLVGANTFRNPGLVAREAATLDHMSGGRAILGIGGAWFRLEHSAHGLEFGGGPGERLTWMDESVAAMRALLDGERVTSPPDSHYAFEDLVLLPRPVQERLPIMIGGSGEKKTLRSVARYADMWNAMGTIDFLRHKRDSDDRQGENADKDGAQNQAPRRTRTQLVKHGQRIVQISQMPSLLTRGFSPINDMRATRASSPGKRARSSSRKRRLIS